MHGAGDMANQEGLAAMKETTCELCGQKIGISDETVYGQHVLCPHCGGKFSYLEGGAEFSAERLSYAIAECRKNAEGNRYYNLAPAGARMYIGLVFYGKIFRDGLNLNHYMTAMSEVELHLNATDWQYLADNEGDAELKSYFLDKVKSFPEPGRRQTQKTNPKSQYMPPKENVLTTPAPKTPCAPNSTVARRLEAAERQREAEAQLQTREWRQALVSKVVTTLCFLSVVIVGYVLYSHVQANGNCDESAPEVSKPIGISDSDTFGPGQPSDSDQPAYRPKPVTTNMVPAPPQISAVVGSPVSNCTPKTIASISPQPSSCNTNAPIQVVDHYDEALLSFNGVGLMFWEDMKARTRPFAVLGKWYCAVPHADKEFSLYEIMVAEESYQVWRIQRSHEPLLTSTKDFEKAVLDSGAIYANGDVAVIRGYGYVDSKSVKIPKKDETLSVGSIYFDRAHDALTRLNVDISPVFFKITLCRGNRVQHVKDVNAKEVIDRDIFAAAAHAYLLNVKRANIGPKDVHLKMPRVTVQEYDGNMIRRGMNGITLVPRRFMYEDVQEEEFRCTGWWTNRHKCSCRGCKLRRQVAEARKAWTPLHEQAVEQAAAMSEYEAAVRVAIEKLRELVKVSESEVHSYLAGAKASLSRLKESASPIGSDIENVD